MVCRKNSAFLDSIPKTVKVTTVPAPQLLSCDEADAVIHIFDRLVGRLLAGPLGPESPTVHSSLV